MSTQLYLYPLNDVTLIYVDTGSNSFAMLKTSSRRLSRLSLRIPRIRSRHSCCIHAMAQATSIQTEPLPNRSCPGHTLSSGIGSVRAHAKSQLEDYLSCPPSLLGEYEHHLDSFNLRASKRHWNTLRKRPRASAIGARQGGRCVGDTFRSNIATSMYYFCCSLERL